MVLQYFPAHLHEKSFLAAQNRQRIRAHTSRICNDSHHLGGMYECGTFYERGTYMHDLRRLNVKYQLTVHDLIWGDPDRAYIMHARADESTQRNRLDYYSTFYATSVPLNCAHHFMTDSRLVNKHPYIFRYRSIGSLLYIVRTKIAVCFANMVQTKSTCIFPPVSFHGDLGLGIFCWPSLLSGGKLPSIWICSG